MSSSIRWRRIAFSINSANQVWSISQTSSFCLLLFQVKPFFGGLACGNYKCGNYIYSIEEAFRDRLPHVRPERRWQRGVPRIRKGAECNLGADQHRQEDGLECALQGHQFGALQVLLWRWPQQQADHHQFSELSKWSSNRVADTGGMLLKLKLCYYIFSF